MDTIQVERYFGKDCLISVLQGLDHALHKHAHFGLPLHSEIYFEICLILNGTLDWWVEDEVHHLPPNSIYITKPGERHGAINSMMQPCTLTFLQVNMQNISDPTILLDFESLHQRTCMGADQLITYVKPILAECRHPKRDSQRVIRAYLNLFLVELVRVYDMTRTNVELPATLQKMIQYIRNNLHSPPTVQELCSLVSLSRSRVFQLFAQHIRQSPAAYIMTCRLLHANDLLRYSQKNVTQIAISLGFSSSQHFSTAFKRQFGKSPRAYRQALK